MVLLLRLLLLRCSGGEMRETLVLWSIINGMVLLMLLHAVVVGANECMHVTFLHPRVLYRLLLLYYGRLLRKVIWGVGLLSAFLEAVARPGLRDHYRMVVLLLRCCLTLGLRSLMAGLPGGLRGRSEGYFVSDRLLLLLGVVWKETLIAVTLINLETPSHGLILTHQGILLLVLYLLLLLLFHTCVIVRVLLLDGSGEYIGCIGLNYLSIVVAI
jgi:hypothetical protein